MAGVPTRADVNWRRWLHALGGQGRRAREFLGLSQEQVAALADVSQGAVSRFESGRGLATPLLIVVKIGLVLTRALRRVPPSLLNDELRDLVALADHLSPPIGETGFQMLPLTRDTDFAEIVRAYQNLSYRERRTFRTLVRVTAAALASGRPGATPRRCAV